MSTLIGGLIDDSLKNSLSVADLKVRVNDRRAESNDDFLDEDKILRYLNDAIDELNLRDDFKGNRRQKVYTGVNTATTRFYAFATIFGENTPFERIEEIRYSNDERRQDPLQMNRDYVFEADPDTGKQGVQFLRDISASLDFDYWQYIPKITSDTEVIAVDHLSNKYFIAKVLQYVYESEWIPDKMQFYRGIAEEAVDQLIQNNNHEYDDNLIMHGAFHD